MATTQHDIPLRLVENTPAVLGRSTPLSALSPARLLLLLAALAALLFTPWVARSGAASVADPELVNLLRFMGIVKLALALAVGAGAWWRFGGIVDAVRVVAYAGGVGLLLASAVCMLMLYHLPQAVAAYHGAALSILMLAFQDRDLPKLLLR